jgi:hypothetical protein
MAQIFWNGGNGNWTTSTDWTPKYGSRTCR